MSLRTCLLATLLVTIVNSSDAKNLRKRELQDDDSLEKDRCLVATINKYPNSDGVNPSGVVAVKYAAGAEFKFDFSFRLQNLERKCQRCGIHIHSGTNCEDPDTVGGHYWTPLDAEDPWNNVFYNSTQRNVARGFHPEFESGYTYEENKGHSVTVHGVGGVRIGCGVLQKMKCPVVTATQRHVTCNNSLERGVLTAKVGKYPQYDGDLQPSGSIRVRYHDDESFNFIFKLKGLERNCKECGVHIHEGTTCDDLGAVGGHYWKNPKNSPDSWLPVSYASDVKGEAIGKLPRFSNGFGFDENKGHAVVIHDSEGVRIGCGVLNPKVLCIPTHPAVLGVLGLEEP